MLLPVHVVLSGEPARVREARRRDRRAVLDDNFPGRGRHVLGEVEAGQRQQRRGHDFGRLRERGFEARKPEQRRVGEFRKPQLVKELETFRSAGFRTAAF